MDINKNYHTNNPNIKRDGVQHEFTEDQVLEYTKCATDYVYFCETYLKVIHPDKGLVNFRLYPYQHKMFDLFNDNRFSIVLACRQSGKSTTCIAYLLWYAIFHPEKKIAVVANKIKLAQTLIKRITVMLENIPFWMQPGVRHINMTTIEFSNYSEIMAGSSSKSSIRGESCSVIMIDEFAFVQNADEFYQSIHPVISAGTETKIIITSTPNGIGNKFHKLWEGALQKTNNFAPMIVNWWDVPGRDEDWKAEILKDITLQDFRQEYEVEFVGSGNTLINAETLLDLRAGEPVRRIDDDDCLVYAMPVEGHQYVLTVDVSQGLGEDYSAFSVIDVSTNPFEQVAVYRKNTISPILFPEIIKRIAEMYNEAYVIIESNDHGSVVCKGLFHDLEYEYTHLESALKADKIGIAMNKKIKSIGCSHIKDLMESGKLIVRDKETISEMSTFEAKGGTYQATDNNHDDIMMTLVMFGYFSNDPRFKDMTRVNIKKLMFEARMDEIRNDLLPMGRYVNGLEDIEDEEPASDADRRFTFPVWQRDETFMPPGGDDDLGLIMDGYSLNNR